MRIVKVSKTDDILNEVMKICISSKPGNAVSWSATIVVKVFYAMLGRQQKPSGEKWIWMFSLYDCHNNDKLDDW